MDDSGDMFGSTPPEEADKPSAAELEAAGQSALFGDPVDDKPPFVPDSPATPKPAAAPPQATPAPAARPAPALSPTGDSAQPYRVLARKYRPQTFSQLIGQEPMVRTLANAIARGRLAHAFLMTGVRGVGKTSTARLIAKALNCVGPDGQGGPTIDPCGVCEPCVAIAEGRHIDVIEMDAASHTGVDDVREIIEAVRYAAVSARYKIYIIDEVHMLSRNAFNALLKTLEEPPAHVKFLFATTEVDKLPVTVLSRTQRFDLRRIPTPVLQQHFASICRQEDVEAEDEALAMVAAAAEGSVRDGLSILDQAIAHADLDADDAGGKVTAERVRDMLGMADKGAQRRLYAALLEGQPQVLLEEIDRQYSFGVEPLALLRSLMELVHRIAVIQVAGQADSPTLEEREAIEGWAQRLSAGQVHRLWQLLLKGHEEVRGAPDPLVAAQMALLRVLHAADMPDPGTLARQLGDMVLAAAPVAAATGEGGAAPAAPVVQIDWRELCEAVEDRGMLLTASIMRDWVRVVTLSHGNLRYAVAPGFGGDPINELRDALYAVTGQKWELERVEDDGALSLREQAGAAAAAEQDRIRNAPLVKAALAAFPDAQFVEDEQAPRSERKWSKSA
ncbi:DNA polymerase III subunit gamma/tau [Altererythrobacter xixiisoli]|uniref:DNA polymerase III subunit gamma/tau n=2 Tax=Croceibacterium xixiisoli TaxID=1476466 RepID=A0A6I4TTN0_9SPHN|nr:DNA polymerase III subunit gamma/tau [Croceibacterium xixiisoli]MXO98669.1 DNA polymerase III subunit gamma/tau [Croceibacterium xixiisoli]